MKGKKYVFLAIFIITTLFFSSCHTKSVNSSFTKYSFQIIDSFFTTIKGSNITAIDLNPKNSNFLFIENKNGTTIYETNSKGTILHQFSPLGNGPEKLGKKISNIGYFTDTSIIISAEDGYFIYNMNGQVIRKIVSKNAESVGGSDKRLRMFRNAQGDTILASVFRSPLSYDFLANNISGSREYIDKMKFLTLHNLNGNTFEIKFGYESGGIHKEYKYDFREPVLFDYEKSKNSFYIIYSPEQKLYIYSSADNYTIPRVFSFTLEKFNTPIKYRLGKDAQDRDYSKYLSVNSSIQSINASDSIVLLTYLTGIPEQVYDKITTNEETGAVFAKYARYYSIILINGRQISQDIELPRTCYEITFFRSLNYIVLSCYSPDSKVQGLNKYYICRINH